MRDLIQSIFLFPALAFSALTAYLVWDGAPWFLIAVPALIGAISLFMLFFTRGYPEFRRGKQKHQLPPFTWKRRKRNR